jgi:hypothetical protein
MGGGPGIHAGEDVHFASLTDPRGANARHHLLDILVIAICAGLCGAEGWEDIEEYGQAQAE